MKLLFTFVVSVILISIASWIYQKEGLLFRALVDLYEYHYESKGKENFYSTTGGYADIKPEGVILILETFEQK